MRTCLNQGPVRDPLSIRLIRDEDRAMDAAMERRVTVATGWASTRIAVLDKEERYEDSYAITQEFQEWISSIGEDFDFLEASVLSATCRSKRSRHIHDSSNNDEPIEI